jgi:hypothetical protein
VWRVSTNKTTPLVSAALEQALFTRRRANSWLTAAGLPNRSDADSQGGFQWSSQHLNQGVCHGKSSGLDDGDDGQADRPGVNERRKVRWQFWRRITEGVPAGPGDARHANVTPTRMPAAPGGQHWASRAFTCWFSPSPATLSVMVRRPDARKLVNVSTSSSRSTSTFRVS